MLHPTSDLSRTKDYVAAYADALEIVPNEIQSQISRIWYFDMQGCKLMEELRGVVDELAGLHGSDDAASIACRSGLLEQMKCTLARAQLNGDDKLRCVESMQECVQTKTELLEKRARALEAPSSSASSSAAVQSSGATKRPLAATSVDGRNGSDSGSAPSNGADGCKRPRRQKQFPDFVRDAEAAANEAARRRSSAGVAPRRRRKDATAAPFDIPADPDEPTYCHCEQVSYGEMIGCDYAHCEIEWFHFPCVGLSAKPKGKWFCPRCRGDRPNVLKPAFANNSR